MLATTCEAKSNFMQELDVEFMDEVECEESPNGDF
jgi:hypothetical protein